MSQVGKEGDLVGDLRRKMERNRERKDKTNSISPF